MARILILADIHANLAALEAVLAATGPVDEVWNLGDTVGYGPDPTAVCERLAELEPTVWLAGNHDLAAVGEISLNLFNPAAAAAAHWTGAQLTDHWRELLWGLPTTDVRGVATLAHGSLRDPVWEYVLSAEAAIACLEASGTPFVLVGHSHVALSTEELDGVLSLVVAPAGTRLPLDADGWLANPGSVGQPRDGDSRAAFAVLDTEMDTAGLTFHRIAYDIERTQDAMRRAGLPAPLVARLRRGQ